MDLFDEILKMTSESGNLRIFDRLIAAEQKQTPFFSSTKRASDYKLFLFFGSVITAGLHINRSELCIVYRIASKAPNQKHKV